MTPPSPPGATPGGDVLDNAGSAPTPMPMQFGSALAGPSPTAMGDVLTDATAGSSARLQWERSHRRRVLAVDVAVVTAAVAIGQIGRPFLANDGPAPGPLWFTVLSVALAAVWLMALTLQNSRDISLIGVGVEEHRRVVSATAWVFGCAAVSSLLLQTQISRAYLVIALPVGLLGLLVGRHLLRRQVGRRRAAGECKTRVVVLGKADSIAVVCESLGRSKASGYSVAGLCIPDFDGEIGSTLITGAGLLPVLGDENSLESALRVTQAGAVVVAAAEHLGPEKVRKLAWRLDALGVDMLVVPGMTDVAGPRVRLRPIDDLPLIHIARARHDGPSARGKRVFDVIVGTAALIAFAPLLATVALAIKLDDGGPVFFRQYRVGQGGKLFRIIKFRSMSVDAEHRKDAERTSEQAESGVFFKSAADSRVTRVGRRLRATSIDELPQLLNVVSGSMSLVGPRPLVPGEGATIEDFVERRALVKPGMTGLWQVSGRSDVADAERIRLDHSYIDNWSWVADALILVRTISVVLRREGAY